MWFSEQAWFCEEDKIGNVMQLAIERYRGGEYVYHQSEHAERLSAHQRKQDEEAEGEWRQRQQPQEQDEAGIEGDMANLAVD
jgi:hypothetical protein